MNYLGKGKGKGHPRTGLEGPGKGEKKYNSIFFFDLGARLRWVVITTLRPL